MSDHADLLRRWGNAWALAGHTLTLAVHSFRQGEAQGDSPTEAVVRQIDRHLAELALLDREPGALGGTRFTSGAVLQSSTDLAADPPAGADRPAASQGDYYLRVNQLDGARAWSSPWWVGGQSRRVGGEARSGAASRAADQ